MNRRGDIAPDGDFLIVKADAAGYHASESNFRGAVRINDDVSRRSDPAIELAQILGAP